MPLRRALRIIERRGGDDLEGKGMSEQFAITMLGGFDVYRDGQSLDLPPSCQRLVALAALKRRAVPRSWVCRTLWPTTRPDRATARLRTTLWRLRPMGADAMLEVTAQSVAIAPAVSVDWYDSVDLIGQLLGHAPPSGQDRDIAAELLPLLQSGALLDGWTDDWNAHSRAVYRELRTDALDILIGECIHKR
jgi:DNA-binding SARP family transcriptional activator